MNMIKGERYYQYNGVCALWLKLDDYDGAYICTVFVTGNYIDLSEWFKKNFYKDLDRIPFKKGLDPSHYLPVHSDNPYNDEESVAAYEYETSDVYEFLNAFKNMPDCLDVAGNDLDTDNLDSYVENANRLNDFIHNIEMSRGIYDMKKKSNKNREDIGLSPMYPEIEEDNKYSLVINFEPNFNTAPYAVIKVFMDSLNEMKEFCNEFSIDKDLFKWDFKGNIFNGEINVSLQKTFTDILRYISKNHLHANRYDKYCLFRKYIINEFNEIEDLLNDLTNDFSF